MVLGDYIVQDFKLIPPKESLNEVSPRYILFISISLFYVQTKKIGT